MKGCVCVCVYTSFQNDAVKQSGQRSKKYPYLPGARKRVEDEGSAEEWKPVGGRHMTSRGGGLSSTSYMNMDNKHVLHKYGHARQERERKCKIYK